MHKKGSKHTRCVLVDQEKTIPRYRDESMSVTLQNQLYGVPDTKTSTPSRHDPSTTHKPVALSYVLPFLGVVWNILDGSGNDASLVQHAATSVSITAVRDVASAPGFGIRKRQKGYRSGNVRCSSPFRAFFCFSSSSFSRFPILFLVFLFHFLSRLSLSICLQDTRARFV